MKRLTYDAGWMRWAGPSVVGGLGGSNLLRAYSVKRSRRGTSSSPGIYSMTEVLAPTMIDYAPPALAADMVPRLLRGEETWCQGFSEPGTGSNLASLSCRATRDAMAGASPGRRCGPAWPSTPHRCVLLTRTGTPESAHQGITALFVDMDSAGITVRPIETMHGAPEFCEVFFDDVAVPLDRTLGEEGQGWSVAMDLLPFERSTALWHRAAYLHRRLEQLLDAAPLARSILPPSARSPRCCRASGPAPGPRSTGWRPASDSDRRLRSTRSWWPRPSRRCSTWSPKASAAEVTIGDDPVSQRWRTEFLYSRAATIYGGSAEIQRNIIARRLLDLGGDR